MSRKASTFSTAPAVIDNDRPQLASADLSRSYQWPFHLRVHPDRWEYVGGQWRLEIERTHLRPGVASVGGKDSDLSTIKDSKLLERWSMHGDRKWVIIINGDKRIDANGFMFLDTESVSVVDSGHLLNGSVLLASWEVIDGMGRIVNDEDKLNAVSAAIAKALWGLDGPTQRAKDLVAQKLRKTYDQLIETAARRPTVSPSLAKRIEKLRVKLSAVTGLDEFTAKVAVAATPALDPAADLLRQLLAMPEAQRTAVLAAVAPKTTPPPAATPPAVEPEAAPKATKADNSKKTEGAPANG